jgi:hypothetical protein
LHVFIISTAPRRRFNLGIGLGIEIRGFTVIIPDVSGNRLLGGGSVPRSSAERNTAAPDVQNQEILENNPGGVTVRVRRMTKTIDDAQVNELRIYRKQKREKQAKTDRLQQVVHV